MIDGINLWQNLYKWPIDLGLIKNGPWSNDPVEKQICLKKKKKKKSYRPVTAEELSFEHVSDELAIHKVCKFSTVSG